MNKIKKFCIKNKVTKLSILKELHILIFFCLFKNDDFFKI